MILLKIFGRLLQLRVFSGEDKAHFKASEKSFNYLNTGRIKAFFQK